MHYSAVWPALAQPNPTPVAPYMFWLMFRNDHAGRRGGGAAGRR